MGSYRIRQHAHEPIGAIINSLLDDFKLAIEEEIERRGGFCGAVRPQQRRLSWTLDWLAHERDADSLDDRP